MRRTQVLTDYLSRQNSVYDYVIAFGAFASVSFVFVSGFFETILSFTMKTAMRWAHNRATVVFFSFFFFLHIDFFHYLRWMILNGSKWSSEMYKNDAPPLRPWITQGTFTVCESIYLKSSPIYCKIHEGYLNGNVITFPCIYGCAHMHTNCLWLLFQPLQIDFSRFRPDSCASPALSPIICHRVGCCSLTCGLQMIVLCNTGSTGNCSLCKTIVTTWHFHSYETHSLKFLLGVLTKKGLSVVLHSKYSQSAQQQSCQKLLTITRCSNDGQQIHFQYIICHY